MNRETGKGEIEMKNTIHLLLIISALLILSPSMAWGESILKAEPKIEEMVEWDLSHDGMLYTSYDLDNNGRIDFCAWRIVKTSYFSKQIMSDIVTNNPDHVVFSVPYTESSYYYLAVQQPSMYAVDVDEDGKWDLIFKDENEDGVNGNELIHYQAPGKNFVIPIS